MLPGSVVPIRVNCAAFEQGKQLQGRANFAVRARIARSVNFCWKLRPVPELTLCGDIKLNSSDRLRVTLPPLSITFAGQYCPGQTARSAPLRTRACL